MYVITGGAGFIGSNIAAVLDEAGQEIVIVDWLGAGEKWKNIAKRRVIDLVRPEMLMDFLKGRGKKVEGVFHMGAISTTTETNVDIIIQNNVRLSIDLWRWCANARVPLIYASSAATYGDGSSGFFDRQDEVYLSRLFPLNAYGWSKHVFDRWALHEAAVKRPTPPQWAGLKFFNVYGPNEYHKGKQRSVFHQFFEQISEDGTVRLFESDHLDFPHGGQTRDFVWVGDCVKIALWLMSEPTLSPGIYNVGSGMPRTFIDCARAVFAAMNVPTSISFVPLPQELKGKYQYYTDANLSKLWESGYSDAGVSLEDGIEKYIKSYLLCQDAYR